MSKIAIRAALETALAQLGWGDDQTSWENRAFEPAADQPYQRVTIDFLRPRHEETNRNYTQRGWMQVDLCYPAGETGQGPSGTGEIMERAKVIEDAFYRGRTMTSGGLNTQVDEAPEVLRGRPDRDRWVVPLVIRFSAQIVG